MTPWLFPMWGWGLTGRSLSPLSRPWDNGVHRGCPLQANTFVPMKGPGRIKGSPPQADLNPVTSGTHPYPNGEDKGEVKNHDDYVCHLKGHSRVPRQRGRLWGSWGWLDHGCKRTADFLSHTGLWRTLAFITSLVIINRVEKVWVGSGSQAGLYLMFSQQVPAGALAPRFISKDLPIALWCEHPSQMLLCPFTSVPLSCSFTHWCQPLGWQMAKCHIVLSLAPLSYHFLCSIL